MTRNTTTSRGQFARRKAVGLLAVGLLLSGCAAGSVTEPAVSVPSATPAPTPTADPHATMLDLAATFPTQAEWLEDYEGGVWCTAEVSGLNSCGKEWAIPGTLSNGINLRDAATGPTAEAVVLQVSEFASDEVARSSVDAVKADDSVFMGDFDIPADTDTGASTGSRGTGSLVDFERSGWDGYRLSQVSVTTYVDGTSNPTATSTNSIMLSNGPLTFMLRVYAASAEPGVADAEVQGWLDRVFGPETSD
jgi:hypothetical protein